MGPWISTTNSWRHPWVQLVNISLPQCEPHQSIFVNKSQKTSVLWKHWANGVWPWEGLGEQRFCGETPGPDLDLPFPGAYFVCVNPLALGLVPLQENGGSSVLTLTVLRIQQAVSEGWPSALCSGAVTVSGWDQEALGK